MVGNDAAPPAPPVPVPVALALAALTALFAPPSPELVVEVEVPASGTLGPLVRPSEGGGQQAARRDADGDEEDAEASPRVR